jgi:hypothetical protein
MRTQCIKILGNWNEHIKLKANYIMNINFIISSHNTLDKNNRHHHKLLITSFEILVLKLQLQNLFESVLRSVTLLIY